MTISGFTPTTHLPGAATLGAQLPGSTPLLAGSLPNQMPGGAYPSAAAGTGEQPGIRNRLVSAMKAAISELRGQGATDAQIRTQVLAMQAQAPVTLAKKPPVRKRAAAGTTPAKKVVRAKTWKTLTPKTPTVTKAAPRPATAAPVATAATAGAVGSQLPAHATQLPGATVYSYDQHGNPALPGLQGLDPATQQRLGMTPTMLQGMNPAMLQGANGLAQAVDPDGPQVNATNQTSLNGTGTGPVLPLAGSPVPVLGAPIVVAPAPVVAPPVAPAPPTGGTGTNQRVANRNATDIGSRSEGVAPLGYGGYGGYGSPWDPSGGVATPYSPYGSSMTGASAVGQQKQGFFSRLFG